MARRWLWTCLPPTLFSSLFMCGGDDRTEDASVADGPVADVTAEEVSAPSQDGASDVRDALMKDAGAS